MLYLYLYTKKSSSNASIFWVCTNRNRLRCQGSLRSNIQLNNLQGHGHVDGCRDNAAAAVDKARANMHCCAMEANDKPSLIYPNIASTLDERTSRDLLRGISHTGGSRSAKLFRHDLCQWHFAYRATKWK